MLWLNIYVLYNYDLCSGETFPLHCNLLVQNKQHFQNFHQNTALPLLSIVRYHAVLQTQNWVIFKGKGKVQPITGHEGPEGEYIWLYSFFSIDARWVGWSTPRPGRFTAGKATVPIVWEAGWSPGPVWTGAESLAPTGIRSRDLPARSESLYRLGYPDPNNIQN